MSLAGHMDAERILCNDALHAAEPLKKAHIRDHIAEKN